MNFSEILKLILIQFSEVILLKFYIDFVIIFRNVIFDKLILGKLFPYIVFCILPF